MVPLEDARQYLDMGDSVTGIAIKVNDVFNANKLVRDAGGVTNNYVYIKSWIGTYGYMYRDIQMIRAIMYLAMVLVIGVACFNIVSTLVMAVKDKSGDIAVLRTLGAKDGLIRAIFVWYGLLAGLFGSLCGVAIGVVVSLQLTPIINGIEKLIGHQFLSGDIYFIDFLPSELHWLDVIYVLVTALLLSLLASWYPARRASRIDPARVLSGQLLRHGLAVFWPLDQREECTMYYGFDIGGTKIALGVFDENLKLQWETRVPTPRESYDDFLTAIAALVAQADERFGAKGSVGIGIPGMPETDDGTLYAANVPAASGKPLRADLSALLERDVRLDNDANCFALSEAWDDEFRDYPLVMGLILGTGVGGGIITHGKPITGRSYITGEFGHIRLPIDALEVVGRDFPLTRCGCGQHGCIENYLSGRGFAWLYEHFYHQKLEAPQIITLWEQGDAQAREHVERYLDLLAVCLGNILTIVDPDLLVIGGGLSNFTAITEQLSGRLPRHLLPVARVPRIERARHGDAGGMRGAAFLHLTD